MRHTVELDLKKKIILVIEAEDEQDAEDIVTGMVETEEIYDRDEFMNSFETDYDIRVVEED